MSEHASRKKSPTIGASEDLSIGELFASDGPFASFVPDFVARTQQQELAACIARAIRQRDILVAESPTGTGKTWSYLAPALLAGGRIIISTGTRHLQDQVYKRDLPQVISVLRGGQHSHDNSDDDQQSQATLGAPVKTAILKGRANYVCHYRLHNYAGQQQDVLREHALHLKEIRNWADASPQGDLAELHLPDSAQLRSLLSSTADNCLGSGCPQIDKCRVRRARNEARQADVVIVNHHLFFSDLLLKDDGFGELLPDADTIIFDEAHQLQRTAISFLDSRFSAAQVRELCRDAHKVLSVLGGASRARTVQPVAKAVHSLSALQHALRQFSEMLEKSPEPRVLLSEVRGHRDFDKHHQALHNALETCAATITTVAEHGVGAEAAADEQSDNAKDTRDVRKKTGAQTHTSTPKAKRAPSSPDSSKEKSATSGYEELPRFVQRAFSLLETLTDVLDAHASDDRVRWVEKSVSGFTLHATPLTPGPGLTDYFNSGERAFIFTSATLAAAKSFKHFTSAMGIPNAETAQWPTPFDYRRQALLYVPQGLPEPRDPSYLQQLMPLALQVITAAGGRTFMLFTSHRALHEARQIISAQSLPYPLLVQDDMPRHQLLEQFRREGDAVLLGTASFWEGVDVRGDALSCVIIDKLPFRPPDDPVLQERLRRINEEGGNGFFDVMVPEAVMALKQGAGRLIRARDDTGVLMICDPRLLSKSYGKFFIKSLPPMPLSRDIKDVRTFFSTGAGVSCRTSA